MMLPFSSGYSPTRRKIETLTSTVVKNIASRFLRLPFCNKAPAKADALGFSVTLELSPGRETRGGSHSHGVTCGTSTVGEFCARFFVKWYFPLVTERKKFVGVDEHWNCD